MLESLFTMMRGRGQQKLSGTPPRDVSHLLEASGVLAFRSALPTLTAELERARRYARPLALVLFSVEDNLALFLAPVLREVLRETDVVTATAGGRCLVVMPETGDEDAKRAIERIREICVNLRAGVAMFPRDGWTLEDLIANAQGHWNADDAALASARGDAA